MRKAEHGPRPLRVSPEEIAALNHFPKWPRRAETETRNTVTETQIGQLLFPETFERPRTRGDCIDGMRPCPYVGCKYHLYLDASDASDGEGLKMNYPGAEPWDLEYSCALDIADSVAAGSHLTLEGTGFLMNVTRERIRQVEAAAVTRANKRLRALLGAEFEDLAGFDDISQARPRPGRGRSNQ